MNFNELNTQSKGKIANAVFLSWLIMLGVFSYFGEWYALGFVLFSVCVHQYIQRVYHAQKTEEVIEKLRSEQFLKELQAKYQNQDTESQ
jgi:hypothetical protein